MASEPPSHRPPQAGNFIPCYVINLERASARRAAMAHQLERLGVPFTLFPATDGRSLTALQRRIHVDDARALKEYGPLNGGEIGCALSHLAIYRQMVERDIAYAVVLEDDICLASDFARLISLDMPGSLSTRVRAEEPAMIQLTHVPRVFLHSSKKVIGGGRIMRPHGGVWLASAYFITLEAARRMAHALYPIWTVADDWRAFERKNLVALQALVPNCAWASDHSQVSAIETGRRPRVRQRRSIAQRCRRLLDDAFVRPLLVTRVKEFKESESHFTDSKHFIEQSVV